MDQPEELIYMLVFKKMRTESVRHFACDSQLPPVSRSYLSNFLERIVSFKRITLFVIGIFWFINAHAIVGSIPGEFSVSSTGSASYTMPISVPTGIAGYGPQLALVYNSEIKNGLLGFGWQISGLSAISRCKPVLGVDGHSGTIKLDNSDKFCLDGTRLLEVGSYTDTDGNTGTEYRTEIENWNRVVAYPGTNGPTHFKVWTDSREIITYGGNDTETNSQHSMEGSILRWAISERRDTFGNKISYVYVKNDATGEHYPSIISYAANNQVAAMRSVSFDYDSSTRPDTVERRIGPKLTSIKKRLKYIRTHMNGAGSGDYLNQYELKYENKDVGGGILRSYVTAVGLCSQYTGNVACYEDTAFRWDALNLSFGSWVNAGKVLSESNSPLNDWNMLVDMNGDGYPDLIKSSPGSATLTIVDSTDGNYSSTMATMQIMNTASEKITDYFQVADFNSDGFSDIAVIEQDVIPAGSSLPSSYNHHINVYFNNGNGEFALADNFIVSESTVTMYDPYTNENKQNDFINEMVFSHWNEFADFNGDGLIDIIALEHDKSGKYKIHFGDGHGNFTNSVSGNSLANFIGYKKVGFRA
ncbi:MAG: hypothetical protein OEZ58_21665, partial [Gammaproteobacteria bacterium]|nr:hypothetical protein [Gammaproteobacteria bacterium]